MRRPAGPLLQAAAQLVRQFPQNRDVVVSVARKTDAQMWPALFAAVGVPSSMLDSLLEAGMLQSAACCLLIVDRIEGPQAAHGRALQLIQVSEAGCTGTPPAWPILHSYASAPNSWPHQSGTDVSLHRLLWRVARLSWPPSCCASSSRLRTRTSWGAPAGTTRRHTPMAWRGRKRLG